MDEVTSFKKGYLEGQEAERLIQEAKYKAMVDLVRLHQDSGMCFFTAVFQAALHALEKKQ